MKKTGGRGGKGHTRKHAGTHKHHAHGAKHHPKQPIQTSGHAFGGGGSGAAVHTKAKHPHHHRGLAVGDLLAVCSFEAVAASLRVLGQRVSDDDVLALWDLCGQREVSIAEALAAAARFGLGGPRIEGRYAPVEQPSLRHVLDLPQRDLLRHALGHQRGDDAGRTERPFAPALRQLDHMLVGDVLVLHTLILGVDLPGPHAVLATPDGWWSWGELYDPSYFPHARIEEAWVIAWQ